MTVKFRSVSTATNTDGVNAATLTVNRPAGLANGDMMIAVTGSFQGGAFNAPAGWRHIGTYTDATGLESRAYNKQASSEPASQVWTFSGGGGGACNISIAAFAGARGVHTWSAKVTSTTDPATANSTAAARESAGWQVYCWQNGTANTTVTWSGGTEKHDVTAKAAGATYRGQSGTFYGQPTAADVVTAGETLAGFAANPVQTPTHGIIWSFLVDDKPVDTELWSSTDGDFAVELELDENEIDAAGNLTSRFRGDITSSATAIAASDFSEAPANAADGNPDTNWLDDITTDDQWIRYDFGSGTTRTIRRYRIRAADGSSSYDQSLDPMDWQLQGSNDASAWTTLDTRSDESFGARSEMREFHVASPAAFRYVRLLVTNNYDQGATLTGVQLAEFRVSDVDAWEDITTYVTEESKIRIVRGLQGASGRSDYSRAYYELNNTDGRFSLRNAQGAYYGALQRNTRTRISKAYGTKALQLQGEIEPAGTDIVGDSLRTILTAATTVTSNFDVRIDVEPKSWRQEQSLCGVSGSPDSFAAWHFSLLDDGRLQFSWYTSLAVETFQSTVAVPQTSTRLSLKVTHTNSAGLNAITFSTASSIGGSYTQLGAVVGGTTFSTQSHTGGALSIGHVTSESTRAFHGLVYNFELRDSTGTLVSDVDFTAIANGTHSFTDSNNNRWCTVGNAVISNRRFRFHGEVAEWPIAWDPTGAWVYASVTAAGEQRRLERGNSELSTMRRYHTKGLISTPTPFMLHTDPHAYWAMEDPEDAFQLASGLPSKPAMRIYGSPEFNAADSTAFNESQPLIKLNNAKFAGAVSGATDGYLDLRFLLHLPTAPTDFDTILTFYTTGQVFRWDLHYNNSTQWGLLGYTELASEQASPIPLVTISASMSTVGEIMHGRIRLVQNGADIDYLIDAFDVFGTNLGGVTGTQANRQFGQVSQIVINPEADISDGYVGHVALYGSSSPTFAGDELNAYHYETAGNRVKRLCAEEGIEFRSIGALGDSALLGYQGTDGPFAAMSSAAVSDDGYLVDPLDAFGLEYRTLRSMFGQAAALTVSYTGNELSGELLPVPDDAHITNDFTAQRGGAGEARYVRTDGPLSIDSPPNGVGSYEDSQSYSLAHEGQCVDLASWQVHKGTIDEERFPRIQLALENLRIAADAALTEQILRLDIGERVDITDTPDFLPNEDIRQIVIGYEEWFDNFQHNFMLNTVPERTFESARLDVGDRFASHDSTLYQGVSAAAASFDVVNPTGLPWSETAADFDVLVDGERMTVTSVATTTSAYTTDSFNRADSAVTLGSTDGGTAKAWTPQVNTWGIQAAQAYVPASGNSIATIVGSADFELVQVNVPTLPATREAWINFRYSDVNNRWRWGGTQGTAARLQKVVAGVVTTYTADAAFTVAAGDTFTARCHGSVIEVFQNGVLAMTVSDTFNSTATLVGMQTATNDVRFDSFAWTSATPRQTFTVTRGVSVTDPAAHRAGATVELYQRPYRAL